MSLKYAILRVRWPIFPLLRPDSKKGEGVWNSISGRLAHFYSFHELLLLRSIQDRRQIKTAGNLWILGDEANLLSSIFALLPYF